MGLHSRHRPSLPSSSFSAPTVQPDESSTVMMRKKCKMMSQKRFLIILLLPALLFLNKLASRPDEVSFAPPHRFDRLKERRVFSAQQNLTKERHRPFTLPPANSNRSFDILFVGCYLPMKKGKDEHPVPNKGDYMYRDAWEHAFASNPEEKFKVHTTHQARLGKNGTLARELVEKSRFVVFGGGGIIYNSLDRRNGTGEFELFVEWHKILLETKTPYALGSIGLQAVNFKSDYHVTETMDFNELDDGKFKVAKPFIRDAVFITCRSPSDQHLFAQWNPYSYYYPDLCFALKKIGLKKRPFRLQKPKRNLLLTVGGVFRFVTYASELNEILSTGKYIHHHIVTSLDDTQDPLNFTTIGFLNEPERIHFPYLQNDDLEFESAQYVYTERYHGFVMAMLNDVPHVVPLIRSWKLVTFAYHDGKGESMPELAMQHIEMIKSVFK